MKSLRIVLASMALLLVPAGAGFAQQPLDHFLVYEHDPIPAGYNVRLLGQFESMPIGADLIEQTHFANPTKKEHSGVTYDIYDEWRHLNWYRIVQQDPEPVRHVRYWNQFGDGSVKIQDPVFLLVPAEKLTHPGGSQPPVDADHYKCYEIVSLGNVPPTPVVGLGDQFQYQPNVGVFSPIFFCNPVEKHHDGAVFPIINPDEHLVVYDISPWTFWKGVGTRDQFQSASFEVQRTVWLAVPTKKLSWFVTATPVPTDG